MLSRILQALWAAAVLLLGLVLAWGWPSPRPALLLLALFVLGYFLLLALHFVLLDRHWDGSSVAVPRPRLAQLLRAWRGEVVAAFKVFLWWQPFRSQAVADYLPERPTGQRGVVLIHGFVCNRALWMPWFALMRSRGHAYVAVTLEPVLGGIDDYVATIDAAVRRVTQATGKPPVLVCHSMGGLAARAWLRSETAEHELRVRRAEHVITIGTPHAGTWLARLHRLRFGLNAQQMHPDNAWLKQLAQDEARIVTSSGRRVTEIYSRFTCYYSHCDNIVFPIATATLQGADNRHVPATAHVALALDPQLQRECLALIASIDASP